MDGTYGWTEISPQRAANSSWSSGRMCACPRMQITRFATNASWMASNVASSTRAARSTPVTIAPSAPASRLTQTLESTALVTDHHLTFGNPFRYATQRGRPQHNVPPRQRQGLHPRVHRHHRAQPRELHAPHDRELEPDRAGRTASALLRRLGG